MSGTGLDLNLRMHRPHSTFAASICLTAFSRDSGNDGGVSSTVRISAFEQGRAWLSEARSLLCCAARSVSEVSCEVTVVVSAGASSAPAPGARGVSALATCGAIGEDLQERRRAASSAVRSSSRPWISRRALSWARCMVSRRSEHRTTSPAFAPPSREGAAVEREVPSKMSATARNDTGTDLAGISVLSLDFPPPTRLHSSLHPNDSTTCVVRSQQLDNLDAPSKNNVQDIWYMRKSPLRSVIVRKNAPLACVHQPEGAKLTHRRHSDRVLRSKLSLKRVTYDGARCGSMREEGGTGRVGKEKS